MIDASTLRELFEHNDWARDKVVTLAAGRTHTTTLGDVLLHVCVQGVHHRAQALNMLRHLGAEVPALDYIVWLQGRQPAIAGNERR